MSDGLASGSEESGCPQVYILGELGQRDSRCQLVNRGLTCSFNTIRKMSSLAFSFEFKFPQSSRILSLEAIASTSSNENSTTNNRYRLTPAIGHPSFEIAQDYVVSNSHCTGTALSSYFECLTAPSSISSHAANFHADGSISFDGAPEYTGLWVQPNSSQQLKFEYFENGEKMAEFNGWAVGGQCFEGMTTFFPASNYVSPYRVCLQ